MEEGVEEGGEITFEEEDLVSRLEGKARSGQIDPGTRSRREGDFRRPAADEGRAQIARTEGNLKILFASQSKGIDGLPLQNGQEDLPRLLRNRPLAGGIDVDRLGVDFERVTNSLERRPHVIP